MADFGAGSTTLSDPQGQGTSPVAPVQERVSPLGPSPFLHALGDIFVNGLEKNAKANQLAMKNAVVGEYLNKEQSYIDAMNSGQWNSSRVSAESKSNFTKILASHPEYVNELTAARTSLYGGSQLSDVQQQEEADKKLKEQTKAAASGYGFQFYPGMSKEAEESSLKAYQTGRMVENQFDEATKRAAESRAQRSDVRAEGSYAMTVDEHVQKETAAEGLRKIADANFDSLQTSAKDLIAKVESGSMTYDQALAIHSSNIFRIKAALNAVASTNPQLAAPWTQLFNDMDSLVKERMDPKKRSADELAELENRFKTIVAKGKLAAVERDPSLTKAVVATTLFPGDSMVMLAGVPAVKSWLLSNSGADPTLKPASPVVGTGNDKAAFATMKKAINNLQSGKIAPADKEKATIEATNLVNKALKETAGLNGDINPAALKEASSFFASTEFGKLALEGKIDRDTALNAQHVFTSLYEPAVKDAIIRRLEAPSVNGKSLMENVNIKMVGNNVTFESKTVKQPAFTYRGAPDNQGKVNDERTTLNDAAAGLNQLVHLHAHLEGTTDYAKYWEDHKHEFMPQVFPDPNKLKPGQVVTAKNGKKYKYVGGNYNDITNSYVELPNANTSD